jgi:sucrose-6-phosphate hydrolase SacC (GH32 family)
MMLTSPSDPFFEPWPEMDNLLGASEPHYYAVFGSGIKGVGPRMPLWTAPAKNLTDWSFLGALWEPEANSSFGPVLSTGTNGFNFEVSGFYSIPDSKGNLHYYTTYGTEGGNVSFHESAHWALWAEGTVTPRENGSAQFNQIAGGAADWGLGYAITQFKDTKNDDRRIQWVWVPEDLVGDGGLFSATQQGFQGALSIPREIFVHEVDGVLNSNGSLNSGEAFLSQRADGTYHASTQGRRPASDVIEGLRNGAEHCSHGTNKTYTSSQILSNGSAASYEILASLSPSSSGPVGLTIAASPDGSERTHIFYNPSNSTILVDRSASSQIKEFGNATVTGYFHPYTLASTKSLEKIQMHVIVDGSLVEVFVNERFALSTRVYPSQTCSTGYGVYVGEGGSAVVEKLEAWVGLANVWPERPANSSSKLVWDTIEQTNNYTWWSGN